MLRATDTGQSRADDRTPQRTPDPTPSTPPTHFHRSRVGDRPWIARACRRQDHAPLRSVWPRAAPRRAGSARGL